MNSLLMQVVIFLALWLVASLVWSVWLDGVSVPIAGCVTSLAALGLINVTIHLR